MRKGIWRIALIALIGSGITHAQSLPLFLSQQPEVESVYAPPAPPTEEEQVNAGGVNMDLQVRWMTDYVFRGVEFSDLTGHEDASNLQFDGVLSFNLGKLPHPFIGLFANVYDSDPISRFQEIRPVIGAELTLKPFLLTGAHNTYVYPNREESDTGEVWGRIELDDSFAWNADTPIFSPYIMAAYDYDLNNGWYFETGVRHDFVVEDTGLVLTVHAAVGYVSGIEQWFDIVFDDESGFQHYEVGLTARYSLNTLLNVSRRFGEWTINGFLNYTDGLSDRIPADTQLWGGVGIGFRY